MQDFIHFMDPQKTADGVTKSNGTLGYIHLSCERSITRNPVVCLELRPIWEACFFLELLDSVNQYALFCSVEVKRMLEELGSQHLR